MDGSLGSRRSDLHPSKLPWRLMSFSAFAAQLRLMSGRRKRGCAHFSRLPRLGGGRTVQWYVKELAAPFCELGAVTPTGG